MQTTADNLIAAVVGAVIGLVVLFGGGYAIWRWDGRQLRRELDRLRAQGALGVHKRLARY